MSRPPSAEQIAKTMLELLQSRADNATICPSEVARVLEPVQWRPLMPQIREVAIMLAAAGEVELRQRGAAIEPFDEIRGPLRIALPTQQAGLSFVAQDDTRL